MLDRIWEFLNTTGFADLYWGNVVMMMVGGVLIFLAIRKRYEPLLLIPIGFGVILTNIPATGLMEEGGLINYLGLGVHLAIFPPLIFLGIGALTDFSPLLSNPKTFFLGAAAQVGIFVAIFGALALGFSLDEAGSIGIIGGADGPPHSNIHLGATGSRSIGSYCHRRLFLYGTRAYYPTTDYASAYHQEGARHRNGGPA
jgi:oxaloacetate decarboxylase beta subunit